MKRLIVCCDGTWNTPDQPYPTNVAKLRVMLPQAARDGTHQRVYYDTGVGTGGFDRIRGGVFGWGLSNKIKDAYRFLMAEYEPGDELYFFGFSRGAYTVRSAVGLIRNSGLLRRESAGQLGRAYKLYRRRDDDSRPSAAEAVAFREKFSHQPRVKFIGVWDTVGALGVPLDGPFRLLNHFWRFHDTELSGCVDNAFQALAIDEHRKPFKPAVWHQDPEDAGKQTLEQVWFAGAHSNVGGGYKDSGLSDIALLWMIEKAKGCGLEFNTADVAELKPAFDAALVNSQTLFYKLLGGDLIRTIGEFARKQRKGTAPATTYEKAADSAVARRDKRIDNYDPSNLNKFLLDRGEIAAVPPSTVPPHPLAPAPVHPA